MTERERFEAWWDTVKNKPVPDVFPNSIGKDVAYQAWQAALKCGEPLAMFKRVEYRPYSGICIDTHSFGKTSEELINKPLYTSPPNTYTESEVDEMLMKVAMEVSGLNVAIESDVPYSAARREEARKGLRAIVDKVKATEQK